MTSSLVLALSAIPLAIRVAVRHILGLSEQSKYLDLRTEVSVALLRFILAPDEPDTITASQKQAIGSTEIKGRIWISNYTAPAPPETSVRDSLIDVAEKLQHPLAGNGTPRKPDIVPVEAEWTGYRAEAGRESALPDLPERDIYTAMMKDCKRDITILYFHGGAYWMLDPSSHRASTKKLAQMTGGRCYSVRYRLAPQHPFPSALLDALISYLALLYPPPGAFHEPVKPENIVFAGDSAGGNLSLALLQTVLQLQRRNMKISWFGEQRVVPIPAGVALNSPWMDITLSSPSCQAYVDFDYLPPRMENAGRKPRPPCAVWPANPPRKALYADDDLRLHPLVTLLMAPSWKGAPPVFMCAGWELLSDEIRYVASRLHKDGVKVVFEEYQAMPHCFAMVFGYLDEAKRCWAGWTEFIRKAIEDPAAIESTFTRIKAKILEEVAIDEAGLIPYTEEEMKRALCRKCEMTTSGDSISKL